MGFILSQGETVRLMGRVARVHKGRAVRTGAATIRCEAGWWWKRAISAASAAVTDIVLVILVATEFVDGACIVVLALMGLVMLSHAIKCRDRRVAAGLSTRNDTTADLVEVADLATVPVGDIRYGTLRPP